MPYDDSKYTQEEWVNKTEYSYTYATNLFYKKTPDGKIQRMKQHPRPDGFALRIMKNAPNWVKR
jgi:hypothetical protein